VWGAGIPAGSNVLLKPNVVSPSPSGSGRITDARVTEAAARAVLEQNPGRVVIGEGSSVGYDFPGRKGSLHCMEVSGTADVARLLLLPAWPSPHSSFLISPIGNGRSSSGSRKTATTHRSLKGSSSAPRPSGTTCRTCLASCR